MMHLEVGRYWTRTPQDDDARAEAQEGAGQIGSQPNHPLHSAEIQ
jgi:uncharacterized protein affecting Mg2+/Co2+ transport